MLLSPVFIGNGLALHLATPIASAFWARHPSLAEEGHRMAMIRCFECGKKVSSAAYSCPHCGVPIRKPVDWGRNIGCILCGAALLLLFGIVGGCGKLFLW